MAILRQWDHLVEEVWFSALMEGRKFLQLVLSAALKQETLHLRHEEHGHSGVDRTTELIWQRCYWPGLGVDVKNWVQQGELLVPHSYMGHLLTSQPNEILALDFTLLEPSLNGFDNVLVLTDGLLTNYGGSPYSGPTGLEGLGRNVSFLWISC